MAAIDLVEDDVSLQRLVGAVLELAGHRVRVLGTLGEALSATPRTPPELVITDVGLPDGTGLELVRRLRGQLPGLPILVVSGGEVEDEQWRALGEGASDFLAKPFTGDELLARCALLLQTAHLPLPRAM